MTALDNRADWWSRAACLSVDPDLFFPVSSQGPGRGQAIRAKAVCGRCPVARQCLSYALAAGSRAQGIWGGLSEDERVALQRRERRHHRRLAAGA